MGLQKSAMFLLRLVIAAAISSSIGLTGAAEPTEPPAAKLVTIDGIQYPVRQVEIRDGQLSGSGLPAGLTLDDVLRIQLVASSPTNDTHTSARQPAATVELRGGGSVHASEVTIADERCKIAWLGEPLSISLDDVRSIRLNAAINSEDFERVRRAPSAIEDRLVLRDAEGNVTTISGTVESLDAAKVVFEAAGQQRRISRDRLLGVVIAQPAAAQEPPYCLVSFRDGSRLSGRSLSLVEGMASLEIGDGATARFLWTGVSGAAIRSPRVQFLSEVKPLAEEQQPIVTAPLPAQRNRSVGGSVLKIGSQTFENGLGVHARSTLTFAADGQWDWLIATIGLDAAANGRGDCQFQVLADGERLFERRMTGSDSGELIRVPLAGRSRVTLQVAPGEGLDLADHADWAEVRLIKNR
jgi:hypothetical protein